MSYKKFTTMLFSILLIAPIYARDYEGGGIKYTNRHLNPDGNTSSDWGLVASEVVSPSANMEIVERFVYNGPGIQITPTYEYVKGIDEGIFNNCSQLQTLTISTSSSYRNYDSPGFKGCDNLSRFIASKGSGFKVMSNVLFRDQTLWAFPPKPLTKYEIPSSTNTIGVRAFAYCNIGSLSVPPSVISFGKDCFKEFYGEILFNGTYNSYDFLNGINPQSIITISDPSEAKKVRDYFSGEINGLVKLNLVNYSYGSLIFTIITSDLLASNTIQSIKVGDFFVTPNNENSDFPNLCTIDNLEPNTDYTVTVNYIDDFNNERTFTQTLRTKAISSQDIEATLIGTFFGGFDYNLSKTISDLRPDEYEYGTCVNEVTYIPFEDSDQITISGLSPNTYYNVKPYIKFTNNYYCGKNQYISTKDITLNVGYESYQTAIHFTGNNSSSKDKTFNPSSVSIWSDRECTRTSDWLKNLTPNTSYVVYAKVFFNDKYLVREVQVQTRSINLNICGEIGPTTLYCWYTYDKPESYAADIDKFLWNNVEESGQYLEQNGLKPSTSYTIKISAILKDGKRIDATRSFKTTSLNLEILQPKIPNDSKALASASTNISYRENHAGFQWKKYDAPSSLQPSEGYAYIYEGILQGVLNNLQSNHYYNIRAFYKDNDGNYYYSDWLTFDPSDFSWLDPTVHTYKVENITNNSAQLRGYVLTGSSDIESQGFEYWKSNTPNDIRKVHTNISYSETDKQTILSSGQMMIANLSSLQSGTEYIVRTFVATPEGTFYGEEREFTTDGTAGIYAIEDKENEILPIAFYNLSGYKSDVPFKGVNIVLMNDGSTRKLVFK